jgi:hypothetical protein
MTHERMWTLEIAKRGHHRDRAIFSAAADQSRIAKASVTSCLAQDDAGGRARIGGA